MRSSTSGQERGGLTKEESDAYVIVKRSADTWERILSWSEVNARISEDRIYNTRYFKVGNEAWPTWKVIPVPARKYIWLVMNAISRTARKLGLLSLDKWKRPKLIIEDGEVEIPKIREGANMPATQILNNVLYCIIEYSRTTDLRGKISWLRLAITFLASYTYDKEARAELQELLKRVISIQRSFNLDLYEYVKTGHFDLVKEEEWRAVLAKQAELDNIRDELVSVLLNLGLADLDFASVGEPAKELKGR